jgi:hypothetical protein
MHDLFLKEKVIVFIAPVYYGYEARIQEKMEALGAKVIFFPELQFNLIYSFFLRCPLKLFLLYVNLYYNKIIDSVKTIKRIDYLFVIKGHKLPDFFVGNIKKCHPKVKSIMYQWDSQKLFPYLHLRVQFDKTFTFDYGDSEQYGIPYLPLFFTDDIYDIRKKNQKEKKYDYFFLATYSYERYLILLKMIESNKNIKFKHILYMKKSTFIRERIKCRKINRQLVSLDPVKRAEYINYLSQSRCIIDITHSAQSGLPIRIIESIGALVDVLSTNSRVIEEFNNKAPVGLIDNDYVFDMANIVRPETEDTGLVDEYSLANWLKKIFKQE